MITCRRAAELASLELDRPLGFFQNTGLRVHLVLCRNCRRFARQIAELDELVATAVADRQFIASSVELSAETQEHWKQSIRDELEREPY